MLRGIACCSVSLLLLSCTAPQPQPVGTFRAALDAYCQITVQGVGTIDMEEDYLPHVVNCENGGADFEALKVQAVAARSYAYYKVETSGSVQDGTGDQVYSCGREPGQNHIDAVRATSGQILTYAGDVIAAFFVAGARQTGPSCQGGTDDPTNTERFVTYNEGKSGDGIDQTSLGFVSPTNYRNRGCMSQNGSDCLAGEGYSYDRMLRFYYGEDIGLEQTAGACVTPIGGPDGGPPPVDMTGTEPPPPPPPDGGEPPGDTAEPPPADATGVAPPPDDMTTADRRRPPVLPDPRDSGPPPPALEPDRTVGGCAVADGAATAGGSALLLGLVALALLRRRRR